MDEKGTQIKHRSEKIFFMQTERSAMYTRQELTKNLSHSIRDECQAHTKKTQQINSEKIAVFYNNKNTSRLSICDYVCSSILYGGYM